MTKKSAKKDKANWLSRQWSNIQTSFNQNKTREAYRVIKSIRRKYHPKISVIKDEKGKIPTQKEDVTNRWMEYCAKLYRDNHDQDPLLIQELESIAPPLRSKGNHNDVLPTEVRKAVGKLKNNKGVGIDGIPAELIKQGGEKLLERVGQLIDTIWSSEKIPDEWTKAILVTMPKKGDLLNCANYRTISMIPHLSKVLLNICLLYTSDAADE